MAVVIDLGERTVAGLRARMAAIEEDNRDLLAFARGHWGAVAAIQEAASAAIEAMDRSSLLEAVIEDWPAILGLDEVALALLHGEGAMRIDADGVWALEPMILRRMFACAPVRLRSVGHGHALFGSRGAPIRGEALLRLDDREGRPIGLLALGQRAPLGCERPAGIELLGFLARVLSAMITRCPDR